MNPLEALEQERQRLATPDLVPLQKWGSVVFLVVVPVIRQWCEQQFCVGPPDFPVYSLIWVSRTFAGGFSFGRWIDLCLCLLIFLPFALFIY